MGSIDWGKRIKAFRKLKGYTQIQFAQKLGISVSVIGEIERGAREPTRDLIIQITEVLDITMEELQPKKY
ncbi:helix-turn-helix domain-containing protein [Aquibacillus koreensis]|uniref:Helix-turn-helix domain-containing protein n=1 Tax=Aquibacillus koreensis TaxID=279446 RepID=A0A9X3WNW8_9BACI|nr:helix-turn-helix transcriptional regulator [Aquibacillus koreensis]MCT2535304.1 helix-turn-helix domain-containing protein [Aquibacillus koreensis]MDC3422355.1 helix-turn-helix domain-containing protein [Aquibacillus koreensis]